MLIAGFVVWGTAVVCVALSTNFTLALALFALLGVSNVLFFVPSITIMQEGTTPDVRARVFGARIALTNLSWLPIVLVTGALGDVLPVAWLIAGAGLVTLATAIVGAFLPAIRDVP
jgi:hypothetical protein